VRGHTPIAGVAREARVGWRLAFGAQLAAQFGHRALERRQARRKRRELPDGRRAAGGGRAPVRAMRR
jgi:hypothetical protein